LQNKLEANTLAKVKGLEIAKKIETQQSVLDRWSALSRLIGSADGKKYRNFAQGLTLEIMVSYANNQLSKLSDRYLLIRDKEEPLELNVMDNYQAGEIRSTKNLSGGESFIVSLALALGLSRMSSRNVRVDSLFLDEGFGTLDEDSLETALSTLAGLRQEGKMIGVISHVGAMKERIGTKIVVQPVREGRSVLSGPGCKCIG
jgi:exonuclease SbcC